MQNPHLTNAKFGKKSGVMQQHVQSRTKSSDVNEASKPSEKNGKRLLIFRDTSETCNEEVLVSSGIGELPPETISEMSQNI